jgi:hypothetical protein
MVVDGTYMGMMNETLGNNGLEWDGLGSPPRSSRIHLFTLLPPPKETRKQETRIFVRLKM